MTIKHKKPVCYGKYIRDRTCDICTLVSNCEKIYDERLKKRQEEHKDCPYRIIQCNCTTFPTVRCRQYKVNNEYPKCYPSNCEQYIGKKYKPCKVNIQIT